jgi:tetratricopeptide (TPR) repeat protein
MTKKKMRFLMVPVLAAVLLLSGIARVSAEGTPVPVRVSHHDGFTRIVFDFPKLLAYHADVTASDVQIDFDTKAGAVFSALKSPLVKSIKRISEKDGMLKVDMALAGGTTVKHYRLQRKIVVDIYPAASAPKEAAAGKTDEPEKVNIPDVTSPTAQMAAVTPPATPKQAPAPVQLPPPQAPPPQTQAAAPVPAPEQAPPTAPLAPAPPAAKEDPIAAKLKQAIQENLAKLNSTPAPAADKGDDDDDNSAGKDAQITLSSLEPTHIAVFERSGALWIVTDAKATATLPVTTGTMATFIAPPKMLRFDVGTAYRYVFPKKFYPQVKKQGLSWVISLRAEPYAPPPPADIKVEFEQASRKARLLVPFKDVGKPLTFEDPDVGDTLYIVLSSVANQVVQNTPRLTDLAVVPAIMGMVIRPLKDDLQVSPLENSVWITSVGGLTITPAGTGSPVLIGEADAASDDDNNRLFDFPNWRQGGARLLLENRRKLEGQIAAAKTPDERASLLMKLAILYFANNFGQEALGTLSLVQQENPEMEKNPEFVAIRGASSAMAGHFQDALKDFSYPPIRNMPEVNLWTGYAAAATEQWRMADRSFPASNRLLLQYPDNIAIPFTIYMAESALRLGHVDTAKRLLDTINMSSEALNPQYTAAIGYLRGESLAQDGKLDRAEEAWKPVAGGLDRLYHTKASLTLTRMLLQQKKIPLKEAIERVDNLRFAWRGDGLEVDTLRSLGELKIEDNQFLSGLHDLEDAANLSDSLLDDSTPVRNRMKSILSDLFIAGQASKIAPLEAVSVYGEYNKLLPAGLDGITAALNFADYLIRMDLLDQVEVLIEDQIKAGVPEDKISGTGEKLAAVYLLDKRPQQALDALKKTERPAAKPVEERLLLKARSLSQLNQTDDALAALGGLTSKNALRLKADVLWRAQKWDDAATTIQSLLPDVSAPLDEESASLVINAAVASKLAGNTARLQAIGEKYAKVMATTKQAATFGVVTRNGGVSDLADQATMLKIAGEVDMFKGFLDSYKAAAGKGS